MSVIVKLPKGTKDILPKDVYIWQYIEEFLRKTAKLFGVSEIRTPIFEHTELFLRGVGDTTDIVQKEMYTFNDKGNRNITLKAEGTAPTIRAFIEHGLHAHAQPAKFFYITPVFRYENVQKGRLRQHHQFGVEIFGSQYPICDAEIIYMAYSIYKQLKIKDCFVQINSLGCSKCRSNYNENLKEFLHNNRNELCDICDDRLEKNPLRILDCKNVNCQAVLLNSPLITDFICDECNMHFDGVKKYLTSVGINFNVNPRIVRGLDYYSKTVFEILDSEGMALCGGGRYDYLIEQLGGKYTPAVGFGMGIERLISALGDGKQNIANPTLDLFIIVMDSSFMEFAFILCGHLRDVGVSCDIDYLFRSLKSQMRYADRINSKNIIVIGENEMKSGYVCLKNMRTGTEKKVKLTSWDINIAVRWNGI